MRPFNLVEKIMRQKRYSKTACSKRAIKHIDEKTAAIYGVKPQHSIMLPHRKGCRVNPGYILDEAANVNGLVDTAGRGSIDPHNAEYLEPRGQVIFNLSRNMLCQLPVAGSNVEPYDREKRAQQ
jgi:hypothetical protein